MACAHILRISRQSKRKLSHDIQFDEHGGVCAKTRSYLSPCAPGTRLPMIFRYRLSPVILPETDVCMNASRLALHDLLGTIFPVVFWV